MQTITTDQYKIFSSDTLEEMATDRNQEIRLLAAEDTGTPGQALLQLAYDDSAQVRYGVARNENATFDQTRSASPWL